MSDAAPRLPTAKEPLAPDETARRVIEAALAQLRRAEVPPATQANAWRFSGRWWTGPLPQRRGRPSY